MEISGDTALYTHAHKHETGRRAAAVGAVTPVGDALAAGVATTRTGTQLPDLTEIGLYSNGRLVGTARAPGRRRGGGRLFRYGTVGEIRFWDFGDFFF